MKRFRPSPAMVIAVLALLLATTGAALAGEGTSTNDRSAEGRAARKTEAGKRGPRGYPGIMALKIVESAELTLAPGESSGADDLDAKCPNGFTVVGTGFFSTLARVGFVKSYQYFVGGYMNNDTSIVLDQLTVQATCARLAPGVRVSSAQRKAAEAQFRADVEAFKAAR